MSRKIAAIWVVVFALAGILSAQATAPSRVAVPSAAEQARCRTMIRGLFAAQFAKTTAADRRALARTLLAQAQETQDDPAARYVLLMDASELAAGAGDAGTALAGLEAAATLYAIDNPLELKKNALTRANAALAGATLAADAEVLARLALQIARDAAMADQFEITTALANLAEGAANKTLKVSVVSSIQGDLQALRDLAAEYEQVRGAMARLSAGTANAAADHLVVGRFYALHQGQWERGIGHLAEGSDATLRQLAAKELAAPADAQWVELADGWWDWAQGAGGVEKVYATRHAQDLYRKAEAAIKGITLLRIQSRLAAGTADAAVPGAAAGVSLLPLIDIAKDGCAGNWSMASGGLLCESGPYATLQLPYVPPDEYDLHATFTRTEGSGPVAVLLAARGRAFGFSLDTRGEARFERINNKVAQDNPTVVPVAISNNRRYTVTIEVRRDAIRAKLDGKLLVEYKPDPAYKDLSRYPSWKLNDTNLPGLGAHNAKVVFHAVEIRDIGGKGKPVR